MSDKTIMGSPLAVLGQEHPELTAAITANALQAAVESDRKRRTNKEGQRALDRAYCVEIQGART